MRTQGSVMSGVGMMAVLTVTSKVVRLLVLMVTARFLTPDDFGVVAAFSMVLALAYLFAEFGLVKTLIQRPQINKLHIGSALLLSVFFCFVVFCVLMFESQFIEELTGVVGIKTPLQISAFLFVVLAIGNVCSALFQRNGEIVFIGKVQAFATVFGNLFVTVPLLFFDLGYWAIIIGILVGELCSLLIIIWKGKHYLTLTFGFVEIYELIKYSSAFLSHNILGLISKQIDIALVGRFFGKIDLGNYSRAMQLIEFPNQLYWLIVDRVVFPNMSAMKNEQDKLRSFFVEVYSLLSLILMVGAIILFCGANEIIMLIMGDGWNAIVALLQILAISVVFKCATGFIDSFLAAYGVIKALTYKNIISVIVFIISLLFSLDFGLRGVAYAVVFASSVNFLMSIFTAIYFCGIPSKVFIKSSLPGCITSLILLLCYYFISSQMGLFGLINILGVVLIWSILCYLFPSKRIISTYGEYFILKRKGEYS
jgi:PST family polysaccharide transporter